MRLVFEIPLLGGPSVKGPRVKKLAFWLILGRSQVAGEKKTKDKRQKIKDKSTILLHRGNPEKTQRCDLVKPRIYSVLLRCKIEKPVIFILTIF
jgi:hypothetical protein